jgi:hypothetical protein
MSWALTRALRRWRPRALVMLSVNSTLVQPARRLRRAAVWFDTPAAINRGEAEGRLQRRLERRSLSLARILLPLGVEVGAEREAVLPAGAPRVALPGPVEPVDAEPRPAGVAMAYAPAFDKKGLDLIAHAWGEVAPAGWTLVVSGAAPEAGRAFLRAHGVAEPAGIEWGGALSPEAHRDLRRRAAVFVSGSRIEDYGLAQLEALADGALLVTVPGRGPFPARELARRLDERLVASAVDGPALAEALRVALGYDGVARARYAERARELVAPFSHDELVRRLRERVLPVLLG